jgi:hypothetical protein
VEGSGTFPFTILPPTPPTTNGSRGNGPASMSQVSLENAYFSSTISVPLSNILLYKLASRDLEIKVLFKNTKV